jgi:hypothetical protein
LLGLVLTSEGHYEQADAAMQDGVAIARKLGDLTKSSFALAFLGDIALQQGDQRKAVTSPADHDLRCANFIPC